MAGGLGSFFERSLTFSQKDDHLAHQTEYKVMYFSCNRNTEIIRHALKGKSPPSSHPQLPVPSSEAAAVSSLFCPLDHMYPFPTPLLKIDFRRWGEERERGERERDIDLLFHLLMHSSVDSCMCPDQTRNLGILGRCSNQVSYPARVRSHFSPWVSD